jgi:hypothetical protein
MFGYFEMILAIGGVGVSVPFALAWKASFQNFSTLAASAFLD